METIPVKAQKTVKNRGKLAQLVKLKEGFTVSRDGTKIYYKSVGAGFPVVLLNGMGVSTFFWKFLENHFKHDFQVVTWDYRGHGLSEVPAKSKSMKLLSLVEDCKAVVDELDIKPALFIGHSIGTQVMLEFYQHFPEYVAGMVSCMGTLGKPMDSFYNSPLSKYVFEFVSAVGTLFPKQSANITTALIKNPFWYQLGGLLKMINTGMAHRKEVQKYIDHLTSLDPEFFTKLTKCVQAHSAEYVLKNVNVPMLIFGADEDYFTPVWIAKKMHRLVSDSELFIVRKGSHAALIEQPELFNYRIEKFLKEKVLPRLEAIQNTELKATNKTKAASRRTRKNTAPRLSVVG